MKVKRQRKGKKSPKFMYTRKLYKGKPGGHRPTTLEKRRKRIRRRSSSSPNTTGSEVNIHRIIEPGSRVVIIAHCFGQEPCWKGYMRL